MVLAREPLTRPGECRLNIVNVLVDDERMTGLQIVQTTQTYKRVPNGEFWRRCLARTTAGTLQWVLVRDDLLAGAA